MKEAETPPCAPDPLLSYPRGYYHSHCGAIPYTPDSLHWKDFFGRIADEIVRSFRPRRVFDAGCAIGFLVAALWDRNVETDGRDTSSFAISQVRADVRDRCSVGSIASPIDGEFDLVLCIEVLEHMPEAEALEAVRSITRAAPRILFSSTPIDFDEPTHVNVRPTMYWLQQFAAVGFAPVPGHDASYLCPHAMVLERVESGPSDGDLVAFAEVIRQRLALAEEVRRSTAVATELFEARAALEAEQAARMAIEAALRAQLDDAELRAAARTLPGQIRHLATRTRRLIWYVVTLQLGTRLKERRDWLQAISVHPAEVAEPEPDAVVDAVEAVGQRFEWCDPLRTYPVKGTDHRLSLVVDRIDNASLRGGAGTGLVLAVRLAQEMNAGLRLITRGGAADVQRLKTFLDAQGLAWEGEVETVHAPPFADEPISIGDRDAFLTTSWSIARATMPAVPANRVIHLLEDDERMSHPHGDDRVRCEETLARPDLHCVVNSEMLFRHLADGPEPIAGLRGRATWFEPALPETLFHDDLAREVRPRRWRFLFDARPNTPRALYWRGLEAIMAALEEGVLDAEQWSLTFMGEIPDDLHLPGGIVPRHLLDLPLEGYAELIRGVDLGLALTDTPHPGYAPLHLAAGGAVVVTDTCGLKQSLASYSENIIAVPPSVEALCRGLRAGAALVADEGARRRNYSASQFRRDWRVTLEPTVRQCIDWIEG